jgi:dolichyl-phosphate beta-glucosyltransferase
MPEVSVVVPAYNEHDRLPKTLGSILAFLDADGRDAEVIVVDDGSQDDTSDCVRAFADADPRIRLIRLPFNRGKGHAVRTGVVNARGARILFDDADGATPIAELYRLERELDAGVDIAIGSRNITAPDVQVDARLSRRFAGRVFRYLVRSLTVRDIVDTQCGFKCFTAVAAHDLFSHLRMDGYCFDVELLLMAQRRGYRIAEVPVNWTHQPGSKVNVVLDGLRMARDVVRIRGNALRGLYDRPHMAATRMSTVSAHRRLERTRELEVSREADSANVAGHRHPKSALRSMGGGDLRP